MKWEVNDCGEQTGNPALDRGRDFPMCVEVHIKLIAERTLSLSISVGTFQKGVTGSPGFHLGYLAEPGRKPQFLKNLTPVPVLVQLLVRPAPVFQSGTTRADVERTLGHPRIDGGIIEIGHTRYYLEPGVLVEVPYDQTGGRDRAQNRVNGPVTVSIGGLSID
jgi:hypothetical protein